ncbi:NADH-quinone oxidoreductase subunit C [Desulfovibrio sp. OttesenSCG-928-G15]|nr:NADH-quinone oxidoreductase subunit C [Desulfovibrio sp. OttesenSCG-928-G15]
MESSDTRQERQEDDLRALHLKNGACAPVDAVPVHAFTSFVLWLTAAIRSGGRVASFFAVPHTSLSGKPANLAPEQPHRIFAVLADDQKGRISLAATDVAGQYPSLTRRIPALHLFEREIHEQYGIVPEGHPWLKPVRFDRPDGPKIGMMDFYRVEGEEVHEVAVGPIHAGVIECGHFRFQCLGEEVLHLEISLGYHHRGLQNLLQQAPDKRTLPLMEAVAGDSTIAHAWAYCTIVEALADLPLSPRGQVIRSLALELERLANHTGDMGALSGDVGFLPSSSYCGRLRGDWLNMTALLCGSRFGRGLVVPGGTAFDLDVELVQELKKRIAATGRDVLGAIALGWHSPSVMARLAGIGTVPEETAVSLGLVGLPARACGLPIDARHSHPLSGLPLPPELVLGDSGDVRCRATVRHKEIARSVSYAKRMVTEYFDDDDSRARPRNSKIAPMGDSICVCLMEGWRGEICHTAITDSRGSFLAYRVVDPSFHNWMGLAVALRGQAISDFPLCNKSFNLSYCGHDL